MFNKIIQFFWKVEDKIAFYPSLIATWGVIFALLMVTAEQMGISGYLQETVPALVIKDIETARIILSTLIAGLISILVFSFSMVMIILNQAASNFSPRLLPGLISNKKHQSILGIHLSGVFYCLITLITIQPTEKNYQLPGFSVLVAIIFVSISMGAFIYFIHSISQSIQVDHILKSVFKSAKKRLEHLIDYDEESSALIDQEQEVKETKDWHEYYSEKSGYIQTMRVERLLELINKADTTIQVLPSKNSFLLKGIPIFKSKQKLDEETANEFLHQFIIDDTESMVENYALAFQLITEIAIKAMSPGINDPGTALTCIDYLTELLSLRMKKSDRMLIGQEKELKIQINITSFEKLIYTIFAPFRAYCSHDIIIVAKLLNMCKYLLFQKCFHESYKSAIKKEAENMVIDAKKKLDNEQDLKHLDDKHKKLTASK